MSSLVAQLLSPPLGLREGVLPILFAAVFQAFPLPLNIMIDGVFVKELKAETFERMLLTPEKITIQCVKLADEVSHYLVAIPALFGRGKIELSEGNSQRELLQYALESHLPVGSPAAILHDDNAAVDLFRYNSTNDLR